MVGHHQATAKLKFVFRSQNNNASSENKHVLILIPENGCVSLCLL